jgi:hypothetical protein
MSQNVHKASHDWRRTAAGYLYRGQARCMCGWRGISHHGIGIGANVASDHAVHMIRESVAA